MISRRRARSAAKAVIQIAKETPRHGGAKGITRVDYPAFAESSEGVRIRLKVNPRSSKNQLLDLRSETIRVKLAASPVDGEANRSLVKFMARLCHVPTANVEIVSGEKTRHKTILIRGIELGVVVDRLSCPASS